MARLFTASNSDYVRLTTVASYTATTKISVFCWIKLASTGNTATIFGRRTGSTVVFQFRVGTSDYLQLYWTDSGSYQSYNNSGATYSADTWYPVGVAFDYADPGNVIFYSGGTKYSETRAGGSGTTPDDDSNPEVIGRRYDDNNQFDGDIAEVAKWDRMLSDAEWYALMDGYSPAFFLNGMSNYFPLTGNYSPEIDLVSANNGTVSGATKSVHPRIIYPNSEAIRFFGGAAPATSVKDIISQGIIPFAR